ncbi:acyl-CoA dehydrogenase/oxidase C-terminal [Paraphysoderma sedebokerense]|nr:acyl-CoA dehydrogenase/oxidase C-terminal [Paraphysoderma sedebokerense]
MILNNVEIPREYMLAKYQYVTPEGEYIVTPEKKKNAKLHYTTMIFTRGSMIKASGGYLARAVTVATRYSCIRTQGFSNSRTKDYLDKENKIIDYQIQRYRVFKQLAMAYAINFTGTWMLSKFQEMASGKEMLANVELLPEIAATSSGLKAFCTYFAWAGIEDCRKCCGGNGYLLNAGLAPLAANYVWQITAEGDFIILMLQTGRYLLKSVQRVMKGELDPTSSMVSYLTYHGQQPPEATSEGFHSIDFLFSLIKYSAAQIVVSAAQRFQTKMDEKATFETSFNASALELQNAVRAHTYHFFMDNFVNAVNNCQDPAVKKALNGVCKMFALSYIVEDGNFIGMLNMEQVQMAKSALVAVMDELRNSMYLSL